MTTLFFIVEPEVAGASVSGPASSPVCTFDTWLGDDLVRAQPYFLVTHPLRSALESIRPRGLALVDVAVEPSPYFRRYNPKSALPEFSRLAADGAPGVDDIAVSAGSLLVVSRAVFDVLVQFRLARAVFAQYGPHNESAPALTDPSQRRFP